MAKRVGPLLLLALMIVLSLLLLEGSASAYKIVWRTTGGVYSGYSHCAHAASGELETAETSMTDAATHEAFAAIFNGNLPTGNVLGCYTNKYGCTGSCCASADNWFASVCNTGGWSCYASYGLACDKNQGTGTWAVIASDSCPDGYCSGSESYCTCPQDCTTPTNCPYCGNGAIDSGEQCELPNTANNINCNQTTSQCQGPLMGTRNAYGSCNSTCGCIYDQFANYSCVKGQCGATCSTNSTNNECPPTTCSQTYYDYCSGARLVDYNSDRINNSVTVTSFTLNTCTGSCSCTNNTASCQAPYATPSCVKGECGATCAVNSDCPDYCSGNTRYYSGACSSSGCACSYSQLDCGSAATCSAGVCVPKPLLSVSAGLSAYSINVGGQSILSGTVACSNANCGSILVHAKNYTSGQPINTITGLSVLGSNPYQCTSMNPGDTCSPSWTITGLIPGSYPMYLIASSGSSTTNYSSVITLNVIDIPKGSISAELTLDPATVTAGSASIARANITCVLAGGSVTYGVADCGNVTAYLSYSGPYGLSIMPAASQTCGELLSGLPCSVSWTVNPPSAGAYNITLSAANNSGGISIAYKNLSVSTKPVGVLQIQSVYVLPTTQKIFTGDNATLKGVIMCKSSDSSANVSCGTVTSYARYNNGLKIMQLGPLSTAMPDISCGAMNSTPPYNACPVNWSLKGNSIGSYLLDIVANSSLSDVQGIVSDTKPNLTVTRNYGALSFIRAAFSPAEINLTPATTSTLTVTVNCSTVYCGGVTVKLYISPSGLSGDLSQKTCSSFPCDLSWTINGDSEGPFYANITAMSNESGNVHPVTAYPQPYLVVKGPNPALAMSSNLGQLKAQGIKTGQPVQVKATVTCYTKSCGQVAATLAYYSSGWKSMPSEGAYFIPYSQPNPVAFEMNASQSREVSWTVNFTQAGDFNLGIFANGSAANLANSQQNETMTVRDPMWSMEILSPQAGAAFSKGADLPFRVMITQDGNPLAGLAPVIPELDAELDYAGNGVYAGAGKVPAGVSGRYGITVLAAGHQTQTYINVIEEPLYVTANMEKQSYSWGDNITVSGDVRKSGQPAAARMHLDISVNGRSKLQADFNSTGSYSFTYPNPFQVDSESALAVNVTATDDYGNSGQGSAEASLEAVKWGLNVTFNMQKYNWSRGETMQISVKATDAGSFRKGLDVGCSFKGAEIALEESGGEYRGYYRIPTESEIATAPLMCFTKSIPGEISKDITIEPMQLLMSVVSPRMLPNNILYVYSDNATALFVEVRYPDGTPVTDADLKVTVGDKTTNMTHLGNGSYKADMMFTGSGVSEMVLTAQDPNGNSGSGNISLVVNPTQFNWLWLLLIPVGMGILFALWMYRKSKEPPKIEIHEKIIKLPTVERVREVVYRPVAMPQRRADPEDRMRAELARLEEKARTTQEAKDLAEQQYYKREIDESTFNKLMQSYEEKLIETDAEIRRKRKELDQTM